MEFLLDQGQDADDGKPLRTRRQLQRLADASDDHQGNVDEQDQDPGVQEDGGGESRGGRADGALQVVRDDRHRRNLWIKSLFATKVKLFETKKFFLNLASAFSRKKLSLTLM